MKLPRLCEPRDPELLRISKVMPDRWIDERWPQRTCQGRGRWQGLRSSQLVRIHLLLLIKRLGSFNRVCRELGHNVDFRRFCRLKNETPIPSLLSAFRERVGKDGFTELQRIALRALRRICPPHPVGIVVVDSSDLPAAIRKTGKKAGPKLADRRQAIGAAKGTRSKKSGQSIFFEGYKIHAAYGLLLDEGNWACVPLCSRVVSAEVSDNHVLRDLLATVRALEWPLLFALADRGYIDGALSCWLRREWGVALLTHPKCNMVPPPESDATGCPLCPAGNRLRWDDYDPDDDMLIYRGESAVCQCCPLQGTCPRQFERRAEEHETFCGMVPSHSRLSRMLLRRFRPRIEAGFNQTKNQHRLKDFYLNSLHLAQILCTLSDFLATLYRLAQKRPQKGRETKNALVRDLENPEFWDKF